MLLLNFRRSTGLFRPRGVLSYQSIKKVKPISPMVERTVHESGLTYGLGPCSYDVRVRQEILIRPGGAYLLSTLEEFNFPSDICGVVQDKSSWARNFLVFQNTHIDPGFYGESLTLEATYHGDRSFWLRSGMPICQIKFEWLDAKTKMPYKGNFQNQGIDPVKSIFKIEYV